MKRLLAVTAMLLMVGGIASAVDLTLTTAFDDERIYTPGERWRVGVMETNNEYAKVKGAFVFEITDPLGHTAGDTYSFTFHEYQSHSKNFSRAIPQMAPTGYWWIRGWLYGRLTNDDPWELQGYSEYVFLVADGDSSPGEDLSLNAVVFSDNIDDDETVTAGGRLTLTATIQNFTTVDKPLNLGISILTPTGSTKNFGNQAVTVLAESGSNKHYSVTVPTHAPIGEYTATVTLIDADDEVLVTLNDTFTVVGTSFANVVDTAELALAAIPAEAILGTDIDQSLAAIENYYYGGNYQQALDATTALIDSFGTIFVEAFDDPLDFSNAVEEMYFHIDAAINAEFTLTAN